MKQNKMEQYSKKQTLVSKIFNTVIGLIIVLISCWIIITSSVYAFINHDQTEIERLMNIWNAITCQWHRNIYIRKQNNE